MNKNVLVISTSYRPGGNSDLLADEFIKGVQVNHHVEKISLFQKDIQFCIGCLSCQKTKRCVIQDDINRIIEKMKKADVIVFATPIYFYEMCGQMKTLLDRTNPLFVDDYTFRDIYLIATCADDDEKAIDGCIQGLQGWINCFEKANLKQVIKGISLTDKKDILKNSKLLKDAYIAGTHI